MKNVFVCIPMVEGKQVEIQPISYNTKKEVVALYEKFEKILKCDLSANIRSIYSNRSSISILDTNNDEKPEYIFLLYSRSFMGRCSKSSRKNYGFSM